MARPASLKEQHSSGGIIFKIESGIPEVALIAVKGGNVWCLPKGLVDRGESTEQTAAREVREETGLNGAIVNKIGRISYWYFLKEENIKVKKTVDFYLMKYESGSTEDHDFEVEKAGWFPIDEAIEMASYRGDREILGKAKGMISELGKDNS